MSEEVADVCTECEGGYVQFGPDMRGPCPFCEGTGLRSRQLYVTLSSERWWLNDRREYHERMKRQRDLWVGNLKP